MQDDVSGWTGNIVLNQGKGDFLRLALDQLHRVDGAQHTARDLAVAQRPVAQLALRQVGLFTDVRNIAVPGQEGGDAVANHPLIHFLVHLAVVDQYDLALFVVQVDVAALLHIGKRGGQALLRGGAGAAVALNLPLLAQCLERYLVDIGGFDVKLLDGRLHPLLGQLILDDVGGLGLLGGGAGADEIDLLQIRKDAFAHRFGVL